MTHFRPICRTVSILLSFVFVLDQVYANDSIDDLGKPLPQIEVNSFPRVASVSTFGAEVSLALGEVPVAVSNYPGGFPIYLNELNQASQLGPRSRTSFEALYDAKPDLIVGLGRMIEPYYQRYSDIAPPLGFDLITLEDSNRAIEQTSRVLGKEAEGKRINACFEQTLEQMNSKVGDKKLSGLFLTSAGVTPRAYYSHFMSVTLMERLNILSANGASPYTAKTPFSGQVGLEWLIKLDPDIIFMYQGSKPQFTDSKIWNNLTAVKNNRVYEVSMAWREPEGPYSRLWVAMDIAHKAYPDLFDAPSKQKVEEALCR